VVNDLGGGVDGTGASTSPAEEVVQEIKSKGGDAVANYDSVAISEGGDRIIKTAIDNFGRIDILVNNAGILKDKMIFNMSDEEWDAVIKVHLYGTFYCTRAACRHMREQKGGRIINLSSIGGGGPGPLANMGQANYTAAKAGIIGFSRTVAMEMQRYGVTCNIVFPIARTRLGWTPELQAAWEKRKAAGIIDAATSIIEMVAAGGEEVMPENVAALVAYLASDMASYITGCAFHVLGKEVRLYGEMLPVKSIFNTDPGRWTVDKLTKFMPKLVTAGISL
jgi:NAD(P)-dependent dehydrogenase (short-subunit alcohol dehydrogenase family)